MCPPVLPRLAPPRPYTLTAINTDFLSVQTETCFLSSPLYHAHSGFCTECSSSIVYQLIYPSKFSSDATSTRKTPMIPTALHRNNSCFIALHVHLYHSTSHPPLQSSAYMSVSPATLRTQDVRDYVLSSPCTLSTAFLGKCSLN